MFVGPIRRLSQNMVSFSAAPEDPRRVIVPSGRGDEFGDAERHLRPMQGHLQRMLHQQRHLADLGLAVSKINHDLRNMLASAQLFSDRLAGLPDPTVQRFAPKLVARARPGRSATPRRCCPMAARARRRRNAG